MFHKIVANFRDVSGVCEGFVKDAIRTNPALPLSLITHKFQPFYSNELKNRFFKEVNLYLDKAMYQYIISRSLLHEGIFSWGTVTQYYANFFAISGLIRLHENGFSRIGNLDVEVQQQSDIYEIRKTNTEGLHRIVWSKFYALYKGFDYKPQIFYTVYSPINNNNYYESDRRNEINYNPASGYQEIYQTYSTVKSLIKERTKDAYFTDKIELANEWIDSDTRTQYRIRLLANIISEIDTLSYFPTHVKERLRNREKFIQRYETDKRYRIRFLGWLTGE